MIIKILFVCLISSIYFKSFSKDKDNIKINYNDLILKRIKSMPIAEGYARYRKDFDKNDRFNELYSTITNLKKALKYSVSKDKIEFIVNSKLAIPYSFCSSATYLLFCDVVSYLHNKNKISLSESLIKELTNIGNKKEVIHGKLDGVGIFGHWNADGPGTAVLFNRLYLGKNHMDFNEAIPGDFLKIFWNKFIGKGERGHLVVYLGEDKKKNLIHVWSSNIKNQDGSSGYGYMWIDKDRIKRCVFSRLERPQNLNNWDNFTKKEKISEYLVRIRKKSSTQKELKIAIGIE